MVKTCIELTTTPNHALQRTAAGRRGCNPRAPWPPSLSLDGYAEWSPRLPMRFATVFGK